MSPALPARTTRPRRRAAVRPAARTAVVALVLGLGLSACGAGLDPQTYQDRSAADSTNESIGALAVRNLRVLPPTGGSGVHEVGSTVRVALAVVNTGAEDDELTSVTTDAAGSVRVLGPEDVLTVPRQGVAGNYALELRGLTRELRPGQYIELALTFARNGTRTMLVPVELTGTPGPRREGYEIGETDSSGEVIVEEEEGAEGEEGAEEPGAEGAEEPGAEAESEG